MSHGFQRVMDPESKNKLSLKSPRSENRLGRISIRNSELSSRLFSLFSTTTTRHNVKRNAAFWFWCDLCSACQKSILESLRLSSVQPVKTDEQMQ